jgi:uncharacterized membrane protein YagU involved in acid resistance
MPRRDTPMEVALKGALAGQAGTVVLTLAMRAADRLIGSADPVGWIDEEPGTAREQEAPPARLVGKLASGVFNRQLSPEAQVALGHGVHWGYGTLWGVIYAIVQASIHLPPLLHGLVLGFIVWLVGPRGLIPAMELAPAADRDESVLRLRSLVLHAVYGWAVSVVFAALARED